MSKVRSLDLVRKIKNKSNAKIIQDFGDAIWLPNRRSNIFFDIEEFNNWFKHEFDGYDGIKGAEGIFLRTDKLSSEWVKEYLLLIGEETDFANVQKYYEIVREEWLNLLDK